MATLEELARDLLSTILVLFIVMIFVGALLEILAGGRKASRRQTRRSELGELPEEYRVGKLY